ADACGETRPGPVEPAVCPHPQETWVEPAGALYRPLADRMNGNKSMVAEMIQPPADAAVLIVDAVLDGHGPMRSGCDAMGIGLIDAWRRSTDEEMMRGMLEQLAPETAEGATPARPARRRRQSRADPSRRNAAYRPRIPSWAPSRARA